jgi:Protein of unknown function (DUF1153).
MMSTEEVAVMTDVPDEVQRWTAKRKAAVVMSIVKGETSAAEAAREHGPLIRRYPTFGYRKLWALLRYADGLLVNVKAVYRILKANRWCSYTSAR